VHFHLSKMQLLQDICPWKKVRHYSFERFEIFTNIDTWKYGKYSITSEWFPFPWGKKDGDLTNAIWAEVEMLRTASVARSITVDRTEHFKRKILAGRNNFDKSQGFSYLNITHSSCDGCSFGNKEPRMMKFSSITSSINYIR